MKRALGILTGLALGYLAGWALNSSALVHQIIGAGLVLWLVGAFAFLVAAAVTFTLGRWWR
jgi:hypothetical protein